MGRGVLHRSLDANVAVVGAGPAGAAAAAALAGAGLRVVLVDPDPERRWAATYAAWEDELPDPSDSVPVRVRWDRVTVRGRRTRTVARPYIVLDNAALAAGLRSRLVAGGGEVRAANVRGVQHFVWGSRVLLDAGSLEAGSLDVGLVVDASGASAALVAPSRPSSPAAQVAWGVRARFANPPEASRSCVLMDWSGDDEDPDPTFLYALDFGDGSWLMEETSLARRPPLELDVLRRRLDARFRSRGAEVADVVASEVVYIPLDRAVPRGDQPVVGFGAAACLVHPATGYSVAASLRAAPLLADAVRAATDRRAGPAATARAAWAAVWPEWRRRARALERYGLEALLRCRRGEMRDFFDAFFDQPPADVARYLAGEATTGQVARLMGGVFAASPWPVRRALAAGDLRPLVTALV
jgi:lycopene beta-cyclase